MDTAIFQIFKIGKHRGAGSEVGKQWTEAHLAQIRKLYNKNIRPAPLVIGHPENDEPQLGKVNRLFHHNAALFAEADIEHSLVQKIKDGEISGISSSIYPPNNTNNPIKQLGYYLKHVGFLEQGKQIPAVKGMLDPKISVEHLNYSEVSDDLILFCEADSSLSNAEQLHKKVLYFSRMLDVNYETALHIINQ